VIELIRAAGRKAVAIPGDIQDEAFCRRLVTEAVRELGGLDILVNNAAKQATQASMEDITTEQFDQTFRTNVYAPFWITKAALPHLGPGAAIINTASIQGYDPSPALLDYAQTKACNIAFTKSLAKQLAARGIRVNAVAPGPFWTPLQVSGGSSQENLVSFGGKTPFGRPGQPAEIAPTYVLLASQETSYVTGEVYGVTGGNATP
jgi:NAD(P)-dependent dehydrogenase (short-subunit alcohol dehydrogenase family)